MGMEESNFLDDVKAKQPWEFPHVTLCRDHGKCDQFLGEGSNLMQTLGILAHLVRG